MKFVLGMLMLLNLLFANENLNSIYDNIILHDIKKATTAAKYLKIKVQESRFSEAKVEFRNLVQTWKAVEVFYILGDEDEEYIDTPRYIDIFHQGNEDIKSQLDLIVEDKENLSIALYKNSHKSVNALEYILFTKDLNKQRVKEIALIIIKNIEQNLDTIQTGYVEVKRSFINDEKKASAIMLNALIESSYKLKEWRVGDPAGLSRKYKSKPDNRRGEYFISKNSIVAIESIILTHLRVLEKQKFKNFGSMIESYNINKELSEAIKYLKSALVEAKKIKEDDFSNASILYKNLKKLHTTYYISLIGTLKITSKILDSDGD